MSVHYPLRFADTPDVDLEYTRLGKLDTVDDVLGTRTFTYDAALRPHRETIDGSLYDKRITREYFELVSSEEEEQDPVEVNEPRLRSLQVGTIADPDADYKADYEYESTTGRMSRVIGPGLPTGGANDDHGAWYAYVTNSNLIDKVEIKDASAVVKATLDRTYETYRDLATAYENKWGATGVSKYEYAHDLLGRPEYVIRTGDAFSPDHADVYGYDDRSELTSSERFNDTSVPLTTDPQATLDRAFIYDTIGNRKEYDEGTAATLYYCANELNQYDTLDDDTDDCPPQTRTSASTTTPTAI